MKKHGRKLDKYKRMNFLQLTLTFYCRIAMTTKDTISWPLVLECVDDNGTASVIELYQDDIICDPLMKTTKDPMFSNASGNYSSFNNFNFYSTLL